MEPMNFKQLDIVLEKLHSTHKHTMADIVGNKTDTFFEIVSHKIGKYYGIKVYGVHYSTPDEIDELTTVYISEKIWDAASKEED